MARKRNFKVKIPAELLVDRRKIRKLTGVAVRETIRDSVKEIESKMKAFAPRDKGDLQDSIRFRPRRRPDEDGAEIFMKQYGVFQNNSFRTKSPVSPRHLIGWVRRKLGLRGKEARRAAFAIGMKLHKIGGPGRGAKIPVRFIERALAGVLKSRKIERTFQKEVRETFRKGKR